MTEVDEALSQIAHIRAQLAVSTRFQGFGPEVIYTGAGLSIAAMMAQVVWPQQFAQDNLGFVQFWGMVLAGIGVLVVLEAVPRARFLHGEAAETMMAAAARLIMPFAAAQIVIALVICRYAPQSVWLVPGLWQIITALVGFCAVPSLPRKVLWAAAWFFCSGTTVLIVAGTLRVLQPWMMGIPFAIGHVAIGLILSRSSRKGLGHA